VAFAAVTPLLVTTSLKLTNSPEPTEVLSAVMVVPKSAEPAATTVVVALELLLPLFGSVVEVDVVPVSVSVVLTATALLTCSVSGNERLEPDASGVADEQLMAQATQSGARLLSKPFDASVLAGTLAEMATERLPVAVSHHELR